MKFLAYILFTYLLIACNTTDRRANNNISISDKSTIKDDINDKVRSKPLSDFGLEEEDRIIGPIRFGMSGDECKLAEASFGQSTQVKTEAGLEYDHVLCEWLFNNGHHLYWKDSKVYGMVLEGRTIPRANYRTQAQTDADQLLAAVSQSCGKPNTNYDIPAPNVIEINGDFDFAVWDIGKKRIVAAIHNSGSSFYTLLNIYQPEKYPH